MDKFHRLLGHPGIQTTVETAKYYNINLLGEMEVCEACALAKTRQKNTKVTDNVSEIPGERLFIDISSMKKKSYGGAKFWCLLVDDCTNFCWSIFLKKKSDQVKEIIRLLKKIISVDKKKVKYIRCDNAGENKSLEKACYDEQLGITFEYTPPNTPQYNGKVERKFQMLYTHCRAMLNDAQVPLNIRHGLWAEGANHATYLENHLVTFYREKPPAVLYNGRPQPNFKNTRFFGEIGIVHFGISNTSMMPKHLNRGRHCMHVGHGTNYPDDMYRFLTLDTFRVIHSRNVTWLQQTYGEWSGIPREMFDVEDGHPTEVEGLF
jgi:hypothetical protein